MSEGEIDMDPEETDILHMLYGSITGTELWIWIGQALLRIAIIIILAFILKAIGTRVINTIFRDKSNSHIRLTTSRREQTLKNLLNNVLSYVLVAIVILMILDTLDLPIRTMLAGEVVVGLAIGFGAQTLVKDIIAGFFIIFEDQFSVGDCIEIGEIEGDVEVIGLRTTKLRSYFGQQYVIPNGNIDIITNYSAANGFAMVEINIPYEANILKAEKLIEQILQTLPANYDIFIGEPEINGVQALEESNYVLRIRAETLPVAQWEGARVIRKEVKEKLFEAGVEIPSPRLLVYSKDDRMEKAREI